MASDRRQYDSLEGDALKDELKKSLYNSKR